jgi:hypothetical protein
MKMEESSSWWGDKYDLGGCQMGRCQLGKQPRYFICNVTIGSSITRVLKSVVLCACLLWWVVIALDAKLAGLSTALVFKNAGSNQNGDDVHLAGSGHT